MATNPFQLLRELMPEAQVLVGLVTEVHDDDTSTVQLPGPAAPTEQGANIFTGPTIQARGSSVPVNGRAFVRQWQSGWVIETRAPDGDILDIPVGTVTLPPPPPAPAPPPPPPAPSGPAWSIFGEPEDVGNGDLFYYDTIWGTSRLIMPEKSLSTYNTTNTAQNPTAGTWNFPTLPVSVYFKRF